MKNMKMENMELWHKWEHGVMKKMRIWNYWKYKNIELWKIWEYKIMKDMRI